MRRFFKMLFQLPYTSQGIASSIEAYLIKPPFPGELYDVAQSIKDRNGRGLADGWREFLIIQEINGVTAKPTWLTQKQTLIEYILSHHRITSFYKHLNKVKSDSSKELLLMGFHNEAPDFRSQMSLVTQQYIVSLVSQVVLAEIGHNLYDFNKFEKDQIKFWDGLTDRFQALRCGLWDIAFLCEEPELTTEFAREAINPLLREYSSLIESVSQQIASSSLEPEIVRDKYLDLESKINAMGKIMLEGISRDDAG